MRQEGELWRKPETADLLSGDFRDFGGGRIVVDLSIGDKESSGLQDESVKRRECTNSRTTPDDIAHVLQMPVEAANRAADHCVTLAALEQECRDHRVLTASRGARI